MKIGLSNRLVALLVLLTSAVAVGCGSDQQRDGTATAAKATSAAPGSGGTRSTGIAVTIPKDWRKVEIKGLSGAGPVFGMASFPVHATIHRICNPRNIADRIPAGEALVEVLVGPGSWSVGPGSGVAHSRDRVRLGQPGPHECGESYVTAPFAVGNRVAWARVWTAPTGAVRAVRRQITEVIESIRPMS